MTCAFINYVVVGATNDTFTDGMGAQTIASGIYRFDAFAEAFLDTWTLANRRLTLYASGHVRLDNNGGANFAITWTDTALRDYLGFTADLAASNAYISPRKVRGAWHAVSATLREHDPQPTGKAKQTESLGGLTRTTWMGRRINRTVFELQFASSASRLVSPASAMATTYANAASTEQGLTEYLHARDFWSDCTSASNQGWGDGRPVSFFEDASNSAFTMDSAAAPAWAALTSYSDWVFAEDAITAFPRQKDVPPRSTLYSMRLPATEYVAP